MPIDCVTSLTSCSVSITVQRVNGTHGKKVWIMDWTLHSPRDGTWDGTTDLIFRLARLAL